MRPSFKFCWMWIFTWIKLSWHSSSVWDKLGWLNWFWQFLCKGLSSFNLKGFYYSYAWSLSLCERRTSFCTRRISRKLCRFLLIFLTGFSSLSVLLFFLYWSPSSSSFTVFESISSNINEVLSINQSANMFVFGDFNVHNKDWLVYSGGTDIPGESLLQFFYLKWPYSDDLTQMVNVPTRIPHCDSHSPALLDSFLSSNASICSTMNFPPLANSDHTVVSVSVNFPNSKRDAPFHRIVYDYSRADWDGLRDHLRDASWEDIFNSLLLLLRMNFESRFRLELMHISGRNYQVKPHSSLWISAVCAAAIAHRNHFFRLYQQYKFSASRFKFKQASDRWKKVWKCPKLLMLLKKRLSLRKTSGPDYIPVVFLKNCLNLKSLNFHT